jgi:hypothetical protein
VNTHALGYPVSMAEKLIINDFLRDESLPARIATLANRDGRLKRKHMAHRDDMRRIRNAMERAGRLKAHLARRAEFDACYLRGGVPITTTTDPRFTP